MIDDICAYIHNYFTHEDGRPICAVDGTFEIKGGTLTLDFLQDGNFYRIKGSDFNDGVHQYPSNDLHRETFTGTIYKMRPPRAFLDICREIEAWQMKFGEAVDGPYQSESFGGYSYTLKSGTTASGQADSSAGSWQGVFGTRLKQWRKLYEPD